MSKGVDDAYKKLCEALAKQKSDPESSKDLIEDNEREIIELMDDYTDAVSKNKHLLEYFDSIDDEESSESEPDSLEVDDAEPATQRIAEDIEDAPARKRARGVNPLAKKQSIPKFPSPYGASRGW